MDRRRIGFGWTLALLALLGHVAGADCCLIRGAVSDALEQKAIAGATAAAHACCASEPAAAPGGNARDEAPLPECCGITCAPIAALEAPVALPAPASAPAALAPAPDAAAGVPLGEAEALVPESTGPPPAHAPRATRGRAPPTA